MFCQELAKLDVICLTYKGYKKGDVFFLRHSVVTLILRFAESRWTAESGLANSTSSTRRRRPNPWLKRSAPPSRNPRFVNPLTLCRWRSPAGGPEPDTAAASTASVSSSSSSITDIAVCITGAICHWFAEKKQSKRYTCENIFHHCDETVTKETCSQ